MKIKINGEIETINQEKLPISTLLKMKDVESPEMVSVQLNGEIVESEVYEGTLISDRDEVEFLYFMGGGAN